MSSLRNNYHRVANSYFGFLIRNITDDGTELGDENMNVNGSSTVSRFYTQPPADQFYRLFQGVVAVSDSGNAKLNDFGSINGPLTNGIRFFLERDGVIVDTGTPIKTNRGLQDLGGNVQLSSFSSIDLNIYTFDIQPYFPKGIELRGDTNDRFGWEVRDNLTGLTSFTTGIKGQRGFLNI